eukprot:6191433-Pleurochrysis_carterae.AAC.1
MICCFADSQRFEPDETLSGDALLTKWDPEVISRVLAMLSPDKCELRHTQQKPSKEEVILAQSLETKQWMASRTVTQDGSCTNCCHAPALSTILWRSVRGCPEFGPDVGFAGAAYCRK